MINQNKNKNEITITIANCSWEDIFYLREGLLETIKKAALHLDTSEVQHVNAGEHLNSALTILEALLPSIDQERKIHEK